LFGKLTQRTYALYVVRVPQTRALPPIFFRFHLNDGQPYLNLMVDTINPRIGLSPMSKRPFRGTKKSLASRYAKPFYSN